MRRFYKACANCLAGKYTQKYPEDADPEMISLFQERVRSLIDEADPSWAAPVVVRNINDMREELFGSRVVYTDIKSYFNQLMLRQEERIREELLSSSDPLKLGIQYAITGNYIDFGAFASVDENKLAEDLADAREMVFDETYLPKLRGDLAGAKKLVYLTDNCGEVVLDKLLMETIIRLYPKLKITVIVRGAETLNDVDMTDVREVGLDQAFHVITNGNNIAGSWLPEFSGEALAAIDNADVILSKGQANFETMRGCGRNVYYMFLCKCHFFSELFGAPLLTPFLVTDQRAAELVISE